MTSELKPCPWCGKRPEHSYSREFDNYTYGCKNVNCNFNPSDNRYNGSLEDAKNNWNQYTPDLTLLESPEMVEKIQKKLEATADCEFDRDPLYPHQAAILAAAALAEIRKALA